jgi:hypothetical protein
MRAAGPALLQVEERAEAEELILLNTNINSIMQNGHITIQCVGKGEDNSSIQVAVDLLVAALLCPMVKKKRSHPDFFLRILRAICFA